MEKSIVTKPIVMKNMMKQQNKKGELSRFTETKDKKFAIRPRDADDGVSDPELQTYSPDLYIKIGVPVVDSPLSKFIEMGIIVKSEEAEEKPGYTPYRFFRPLIDSINYTKTGNPRRSEYVESKKGEKAINENDCLKFGEAMGLAMRYGEMDFIIQHLEQRVF
jgi:hypothetical protein